MRASSGGGVWVGRIFNVEGTDEVKAANVIGVGASARAANC